MSKLLLLALWVCLDAHIDFFPPFYLDLQITETMAKSMLSQSTFWIRAFLMIWFFPFLTFFLALCCMLLQHRDTQNMPPPQALSCNKAPFQHPTNSSIQRFLMISFNLARTLTFIRNSKTSWQTKCWAKVSEKIQLKWKPFFGHADMILSGRPCASALNGIRRYMYPKETRSPTPAVAYGDIP